jgi:hypothetical protein
MNKFGSTRSPLLLSLAQRIWEFCLKTNTRLHLTYVPLPFNPADPPSRQMIAQLEWRIAPSYFRHLNRKWGPHCVDVFAHHQNHLLPQYMSWKHDPMAMATDALSISWQHLGRVYICPPWNLLPSIISKIQRERIDSTLITPWVADGHLVSNPTNLGSSSAPHYPTSADAPSSRSLSKRPLRESALVAECLEHKIRRIEEAGANATATELIMQGNPQRYKR